jgi:hypothetical protein
VLAETQVFFGGSFMKRKLNSEAQQNEQSYHHSLNTKKTTVYNVGNPGPGLRQAQTCPGVKPISGIPTLPS